MIQALHRYERTVIIAEISHDSHSRCWSLSKPLPFAYSCLGYYFYRKKENLNNVFIFCSLSQHLSVVSKFLLDARIFLPFIMFIIAYIKNVLGVFDRYIEHRGTQEKVLRAKKRIRLLTVQSSPKVGAFPEILKHEQKISWMKARKNVVAHIMGRFSFNFFITVRLCLQTESQDNRKR